jgi:hypothetical protein
MDHRFFQARPHSNVAASRQSAANVTGSLDGGFLPKAATPKLVAVRQGAGGKDPANGSLGWTNGAKSVALQNPKGISSFSPALTRSGYAGW